MKNIIITQRFEKVGKFKELRDSIDIKLIKFVDVLGFVPIVLPNNIDSINKFIEKIVPKGIILSGGGDPLKKDLRYKNEETLLKLSLKKNIPLLGICRGAQRINIHFGGKIKKIKDHVRRNHLIFGSAVGKRGRLVNSYHDFGFDKQMLGKGLEMLSFSKDNNVEFIKHKKFKLYGIMWHPERYNSFKKFDQNIIRKIFK